MSLKPMLEFVMAGLVKLNDEDRIRYEGAIVYNEIKQELASAIDKVDSLVATPAPIVQVMMTAERAEAMRQDFVSELVLTENRLMAGVAARIGQAEAVIASTVRGEIEAADVSLLAAIAETRGEVLAAINPTPAA